MMKEDKTEYTGEELLDVPEEEAIYSQAMQGALAVISLMHVPEGGSVEVAERKTFMVLSSFYGKRRYRQFRITKAFLVQKRPVDLVRRFQEGLFPIIKTQAKKE